jgi:hypothetical protein
MADDIKAVLEHSSVFQGLSAALAEVAAKGTLRRLARRDVLFHQGDPAEEFAVVLEGRLKLTQVSAEGQEVIVRYLGPARCVPLWRCSRIRATRSPPRRPPTPG